MKSLRQLVEEIDREIKYRATSIINMEKELKRLMRDEHSLKQARNFLEEVSNEQSTTQGKEAASSTQSAEASEPNVSDEPFDSDEHNEHVLVFEEGRGGKRTSTIECFDLSDLDNDYPEVGGNGLPKEVNDIIDFGLGGD